MYEDIRWHKGNDKYYLCDAAYANTRGFLSPYRNTRYWLADFRRRRALTKEEKFNHAHAQLRNVIKRAYSVVKARFPILKQMAPYSFTEAEMEAPDAFYHHIDSKLPCPFIFPH
ncbi:hypothetical protein LXL04_017444 [Taraxacum kok-saghyz]